MGTNYYAEIGRLPNGVEKRYHIGKSSAGWTFTFQGYKKYNELNAPVITTECHWRLLLIISSAKIINEYDSYISYNDFWNMVDQKRNQDHNHYDEVINNPNHYHKVSDGSIWKDKKNNAFIGTDFS